MRGTTNENHRDGASILAGLRNASSAPGSELEQAILRVLLVSAASIYLLFAFANGSGVNPLIGATAGCIWLGTLVLLTISLLAPQASSGRRIFTTFYDVAAISLGMHLTGPVGAPLYLLYLLAAFGNGFRFGPPFLYLSMALSLIGYSAVIVNSPFWLGHMALSGGLLLGLAALPLYVATMLRRLNSVAEGSERTSREKNQFLMNIGQQLRTPLNGIIGMSDLLRETPLNREQREFADAINDSSNTLVALIDNVLDYSKIDAGMLTIASDDFDLHNVLNGIVCLLRTRAQRKNLRLSLRIDPEIPYQLRGDAVHLRQVLTNLINNAIQFTLHGRIDVRVQLLHADDVRAALRFEIEDTGSGIAPGALTGSIAGFTRDDEPTTSRDHGANLGAAVARELVELMGGRFGVHSESARGTTFWFELSFDRNTATDEPTASLRHARVLLVSDEVSPNIAPVSEWLHSWGVRLDNEETASGAFVRAEAEVRRGHPYHVIIVDKPLIDIDAKQFAHALRKITNNTNTVLILLTRGERHPQHQSLLTAGYSCLLPSPMDKGLLFNALHSAPVFERGVSDRVVRLRTQVDRPSASRYRILVAEDNPTSQKFIARVLERAGHKVDLVQNGEEALDALEVNDYDLVMLDMQMPVMDGVQTAKLYRFIHPNRTKIPFVMLTANTTREAKLECEAAGIETFLTKPIEAPRLLEVIAYLLDRHRHDDLPGAGKDRDALRLRERPSMAEVPEGAPVLNLASLQEVESLGYGSDFFHDLIQGFIRDGNGILDKMEDALTREDYADFRDASHALKGNAGSIGAVRLYKSCLQIERMSRADYDLLGGQLVADIRAEFRRACAALIEYSKKLGNNARN